MNPGLYYDVPSDTYHSDPLPEPSLSASIAHTLVSRSPFHAWLQHPRLGGKPRKATKAMDTGSICHAILLGTGKEYEVVEGFDDWKKSAAQALRKEVEARGNIALLQKDIDAANELISIVRPELQRLGIAFTGRSEVTAVWDEFTDQGEVVRCRGQMDHLVEDEGQIWDLKFVRSAHPRACQAHLFGFGGDIQAAAYESALIKLRPELAGRVSFGFIFCEVGTGVVTPASLAGTMRELGASRWRRAVHSWAQCRALNKWPAYVDGMTIIEAPTFALASEMDEALRSPSDSGVHPAPQPWAAPGYHQDAIPEDDSALF